MTQDSTIVSKQNIADRFGARHQAERYRDRFKTGKRKRTHKREALALYSLLAKLGHMRAILDVGSGAGRFIPVFSQFADRVFQADYSAHMLAVARDDHPLDQSGGGFVNADGRSLPFTDRFADFVFCHRLLNHLPDVSDRMRVLSEMGRVSGRYVVVSCLTPPAPIRLLRSGFDRLRGHRSLDGHIASRDLLDEAARCGLTLIDRVRFRSFPVVGEFFVLTTPSSTTLAS